MTNKQFHLEIIQGVVNRLGRNAFLLKGWSVVLVSALFALSANDSNQTFVYLAFFPAIAFWILFLRYLDELELEKKDEAELKGQSYTFILDEEYRWANWAMPKSADGKLDHHEAMTGDDLVEFVNTKLFPYLSKFKEKLTAPKLLNIKSVKFSAN